MRRTRNEDGHEVRLLAMFDRAHRRDPLLPGGVRLHRTSYPWRGSEGRGMTAIEDVIRAIREEGAQTRAAIDRLERVLAEHMIDRPLEQDPVNLLVEYQQQPAPFDTKEYPA